MPYSTPEYSTPRRLHAADALTSIYTFHYSLTILPPQNACNRSTRRAPAANDSECERVRSRRVGCGGGGVRKSREFNTFAASRERRVGKGEWEPGCLWCERSRRRAQRVQVTVRTPWSSDPSCSNRPGVMSGIDETSECNALVTREKTTYQ